LSKSTLCTCDMGTIDIDHEFIIWNQCWQRANQSDKIEQATTQHRRADWSIKRHCQHVMLTMTIFRKMISSIPTTGLTSLLTQKPPHDSLTVAWCRHVTRRHTLAVWRPAWLLTRARTTQSTDNHRPQIFFACTLRQTSIPLTHQGCTDITKKKHWIWFFKFSLWANERRLSRSELTHNSPKYLEWSLA